jgi:pantoate--beta-alanine ligase
MEIIRDPVEMTLWSNQAIATGRSIGLVPTMGYFHDGHLSLMRVAKKKADFAVVSLFVNPIQFGPNEDLDAYPRDFERDCRLAEAQGVDILFAPEVVSMYPDGAKTKVVVSALTAGLCGASRPGHFDGVTTVVAKLFNVIKPQVAVFGQKDFQQLAVIRQMVRDLNWDIDIVGHPIVREADGLAMSSRNSYLTPEQRRTALCLYGAIRHAQERVRQGLSDAKVLAQEIKDLIRLQNGVEIDYISLVDQDTLESLTVLQKGTVLALAVKVGRTRLIDNELIC